MTPVGTFQKCPAKLTMSVDGGKADLASEWIAFDIV